MFLEIIEARVKMLKRGINREGGEYFLSGLVSFVWRVGTGMTSFPIPSAGMSPIRRGEEGVPRVPLRSCE